jgi:hypothetical protein
MKNREILTHFKSMVDSLIPKEEPKEEIELAKEEAEAPQAAPAPEVQEEVRVEYATRKDLEEIKDKLNSEVADVKAMFEQILNIVQPKEEKDVPAKLSAENEIVHSPEVQTEEKKVILHSQRRQMTTKDRIMNKLANK